MRIVVTGASGNVGTGLLRRLVADGRHEVSGICRRPPRAVPPYETVRWRSIDVTAPSAERELTHAFAGADVVVHLAWAVQPVRERLRLYRTNIGGSRAVFTAAAAAGVSHLVYASSLGVYAPRKAPSEPVDESWPSTGHATSDYSKDKVRVERMLDRFEREHPHIALTRIRPPLVTHRAAAAQTRRYFLGMLVAPPLLAALRRGWIPVVPLPTGLNLQMVHAEDVGEGILASVNERVSGTFHLTADAFDSARLAEAFSARVLPLPREFARALVVLLWQARVLLLSPGWFDLATRSPLLSAEHARNTLGWAPSHTARQCLDELLEGLTDSSVSPSPALSR